MPNNLYHRGRTWHGRIQVNGRELRKSLHTTSRTEANERLKDWKKKIGHAAFYGEERHTYLRAGGNIYTLQQILGHASIKTTELYLDHLTPDEKHTAKYGAGTKVGTDTTV